MAARVLPPTWSDTRPDRGAEARVYHALSNQLRSGWTVIHDMAWINQPAVGLGLMVQADFVLCHPQYGVIVLEVKGGAEIMCKDHQWMVRRHDGHIVPYRRPPLQQAADFAHTLYARLRDESKNRFPGASVVYAVCFPDVHVCRDQFDASLPRELVIDRCDLDEFPQALTRIRRFWRERNYLSPKSGNRTWFDQRWTDLVLHTFVRDMNLQRLLGPSIATEKRQIQQLSEEQANIYDLAERECRFAVAGCAGSGKTVLAQILARRFAQRGQQVLLCCYNQPLRDYLARRLADQPDVRVVTFNTMCASLANYLGVVADVDRLDAVEQVLVPRLQEVVERPWRQYDVVIVDEGQDLDQTWWPVVEAVLRDPGNCPLFVFYDDNQRVYQRSVALPPNMQILPLTINFRTTLPIHEHVVYFYRGQHQPLSRGPVGDAPTFYALDLAAADTLRHELTALLLRLQRGGVAPDDIVILTPLSAEHSALRQFEDVLDISPTPAPGQILWDTIYRFKGLERDVVIVVEVRRHHLPDALDRLLYVAYSRACHRLYILYDRELAQRQVSAQPGSRYARNSITDGLNAGQRDAVTAPLGTALVWAGAGTGKTHVLTQRIAYLLDAHRIDPQHVLAVTFTARAANELVDRLGRLLDPAQAQRLRVGTFHAICGRLLREEIETLGTRRFYGRTSSFRVVDETESLPILRKALDRHHVDTRTQLTVEQARRHISRQKAAGRLPHESPSDDEREALQRDVYESYQGALEAVNCVDFDDMILLAVRLLEEHPAVLSRRRRRWPHVLVDEFQDTNVPQFRLIELLTDHQEVPERSLLVVGDAQQSIYGWRGARYDLFRDFSRRFRDTDEHQLTVNYRSTYPILDVAEAIAQPEFTGVDTLLLTPHTRRYGADVSIIESRTVTEEADEVVRRIQAVHATGVPLNEIAILMRSVSHGADTGVTMKALEAALHLAHIPIERRGIQSFYGNPVIRGLVVYLRALCDPQRDEYLEPVLLHPLFAPQIGAKTVRMLQEASAAAGSASIWEFITERASGLFPSAELTLNQERVQRLVGIGNLRQRGLQEMVERLDALRRPLDVRDSIAPLLLRIRAETGFDARFRTEENDEEFTGLIRSFVALVDDALRRGERLLPILNDMAMFGSTIDEPPAVSAGGKVQIMTIHASKGLEFHTVFVLGMEEGTLPSAWSLDDPEAKLEEGRICYVALTRARRHLVVSYVEQRDLDKPRPPSRFLEAIRGRVEQQQWLEDMVFDRLPGDPQVLNMVPTPQRGAAIIQLDATHRIMRDADWHHLERALQQVPGLCPVEVVARRDDGELEIVEMNGGVRADEEALADIAYRTGMRVEVIYVQPPVV